ncbi:MAG: hypothetical protein AAFV80_05095 [Bacteroidota bacterium]
MQRTLVILRFKQFYRLLNEIGIIYILLFLIVSVPMILGLLYHLTAGDPGLTLFFWLAILLSTHWGRQDKEFLSKLVENTYRVFLFDYLLLSLPFAGLLIWRGEWIFLSMGLVLLFLLPMSHFTLVFRRWQGKAFTRFPKWMQQQFEWKEGLRRNWIWIMLIYLMGIGFCWFEAGVPASIFILSLITCSFYMDCESALLLEMRLDQPRRLLGQLITWHLLIFQLAILPLIGLFLIYFLEYWYILAVVLVVSACFPVLAILLKYANYQPGLNLKQNGTILSIMVVFLSLPFTQPVPIVMSIIYTRKALQNLKTYAHVDT